MLTLYQLLFLALYKYCYLIVITTLEADIIITPILQMTGMRILKNF